VEELEDELLPNCARAGLAASKASSNSDTCITGQAHTLSLNRLSEKSHIRVANFDAGLTAKT
jgi:hypothetical protein